MLFNRQLVRLDDAVSVIRQKTGTVLTRAALIRAIIDGVLDSDFDVTTVASERHLRERLAKLLR